MKINSHVHSKASDGSLTQEEMIKEAIKEKVRYICFCDHYRKPSRYLKLKGKKIGKFDYIGYMKKVKQLAEKYKDKIEVAFGTEMDWIEEFKDWTKKEIRKYGKRYDLIIGSVHYLKYKDKYIPFDAGFDFWKDISNKLGMKTLIKEYYKQIRNLIKSGLFDCIGHFDYIKLYNEKSCLFDEKESWYKQEVLKTLDIARKKGICIEINTHGFVKRVKEQYPSFWIMKEMKKRNIPITISSDAHHSGQVGDRLDKAISLARKAGYKEIVKFRKHKKIGIKI